MRNALLLHGWAYKTEFYDTKFPSGSNSHWFPWLSKQLIVRDIHTIALEMPNSFYPEYDVWKKEFERFDISKETILVGHSCGGGFLLRWLSENVGVKVDKLILVAPWIGIRPDQDFDESFFDFQWDKDLVRRTNQTIIFNSSNDVSEVQDSVDIIKQKLSGYELIELENKGHFNLSGLGSEEFPELLEVCVSSGF